MNVYKIVCGGQAFYAQSRNPLDSLDTALFRTCGTEARAAHPGAANRALVKDAISRFNARAGTKLVLACQPWTGTLEI